MDLVDFLYLNGIITAAVLALLVALFTGLFAWNRLPRRDRFTLIPALLAAANLAGVFYLAGMVAIRLGYHLGDLAWVPAAYVVTFVAAPVLASCFIVVHCMLVGRWPVGWLVRGIVYVAGPLAAIVAAIPGELGVLGAGAVYVEESVVRLEFGLLAPVYFGVILVMIATMTILAGRAVLEGPWHGRAIWLFQGLGFLAICTTPAADVLREFGIQIFPVPVSWIGFGFFTITAFAMLTAQYTRLLDDLEEGRRAVRELNEALSRDRLTGLYSRVALEQVLEQRIDEGATQGGLLFVDLDDFKAVNDRYGHQHGDRVLSAVGGAILATVREEDYPARWGGDEFIILLSGGDQPLAEQVGTRLLEELRRVGETHTSAAVGASIGFVPLNAFETAETLIGAADAALYRAKTSGKGRLQVNGALEAL